ncbi:MAG: DUF3048 C-terminal domain-containing protein, partial [Candidatus Kerfeldbacteria bacterium]|nr:DUF3048 C-terminal domain-containing protein [Candidatus Kerfeldbacteria bacterium]
DPTAKYFFRLAGGGVHSLYTSGKNLLAAVKAAKFDKFHPPYMGWTFTDEPGLNDRVNGKHGVTINIGGGKLYDIRYDYNRAKNVYLRSIGGKPHKDRVTKQQIAVKNVVLLFVPKEKVLDRKGHVDLHTVGKGKAILFQNGRALNINWQKKTPSARLVLTLPSAAPVQLNRGSTWITILAAGHPYKVF